MYPNTPKPRPTTAIQTPRRPIHPVHTRATKLSSAAKNPRRNHAGTDTDAIPKPNETTASTLLRGGCAAPAMPICWDYCGTPGHVTRRASYPGLAGLRSLAHCLILPRALHVQQRAANGRQALAVNQPGTSSSTWHQTAGEWSSYRHGAQYVRYT